jgi:hypothetical protein
MKTRAIEALTVLFVGGKYSVFDFCGKKYRLVKVEKSPCMEFEINTQQGIGRIKKQLHFNAKYP